MNTADGAIVTIAYANDASAASAVGRAIELDGGKSIVIRADAADVEAVKGAVEKTVATYGRFDVLVNNAGTAIPKPFADTTLENVQPGPIDTDLNPAAGDWAVPQKAAIPVTFPVPVNLEAGRFHD